MSAIDVIETARRLNLTGGAVINLALHGVLTNIQPQNGTKHFRRFAVREVNALKKVYRRRMSHAALRDRVRDELRRAGTNGSTATQLPLTPEPRPAPTPAPTPAVSVGAGFLTVLTGLRDVFGELQTSIAALRTDVQRLERKAQAGQDAPLWRDVDAQLEKLRANDQAHALALNELRNGVGQVLTKVNQLSGLWQ